MTSKKLLVLAMASALQLVGMPSAIAHWCNNIFTAPARMVVKPETPTVFLSGTNAATLRVYVRNNFPHTLFNLRLRGNATGYTIDVSPKAHTARPSQNVSFLLTITPSGGATGDVDVTNLNLQVAFRQSPPYGWQDGSDCRVKQTPTLALLEARSVWGAEGSGDDCGNNQSASLTAATLADLFPTSKLPAGSPTFGRTGIQQLISFFGYRFCYSSSGGWRSSGSDCPSAKPEGSPWTSVEQFGQNCMRAGVELAVRKGALGSELQAARDAAINAMKAGSDQHKCLAAVVGGYLWRDATSKAPFTAALSTISTNCQNAAKRIVDGGAALSCASGWPHHERAACAAAEGLRDNDGPVTSILVANAGDGQAPSPVDGYDGHYYAYMLRIVAAHREATTGTIPFYPDAGRPTIDGGVMPPNPDQGVPASDHGSSPPADTGTTANTDGGTVKSASGGCQVVAKGHGASWLLLLCGLALLRRRRARRATP